MTRKQFQRWNAAPALMERTGGELLSCFVASHDETAFAALVERYEQMIWNVCWRVLHHRQDTEAARQQTYIVFIQQAESIRNNEALASWLRSAAFNAAKNLWRKRRRREVHESAGEITQPSQPAQPAQDVENQEVQVLITTEIQNLPEKYRAPFEMHCLEEKSKREVAQELGLPEGTVASRVRKAREILQRNLASHGIGPPDQQD